MKRTIYVAVFALISTALITVSALLPMADNDKALIKQSEEQISSYNGLWISPDGDIISLYPYHGKEPFLKNLSAVTKLGETCELPVYLAIPPRKMDILPIPEEVDTAPSNALFELAEKECLKAGVNYVDLLSVLGSESDIYFATDHHWTAHGAYLAYHDIVTAMGVTPLDESAFKIEIANTSYRGSDYNKTDKSPEYTVYDTIELYYTDMYQRLETAVADPQNTDNKTQTDMYVLEKLFSYDPYTVYFGGNQPYITIRGNEERDTLLIVRDSFASALAPLLANHFDIVMIDPRFYPGKLSKVVEKENVSYVLVLENMGSFTENTVRFTY